MSLILPALLGYLLGSVCFGILFARVFGLGDLRQIGSGNIGATNVLRTGNKKAAALTLIGDGAKGALAVILAHWWGGESAAGVAAIAAFLGHVYPLFHGFRGGKGVATLLGLLLGLSLPVGLAACATWLGMAFALRYSSLSALTAAALAPVYALMFYHWHGAVLIALLAAMLFFTHRENIARLIAGTEPKIGSKT